METDAQRIESWWIFCITWKLFWATEERQNVLTTNYGNFWKA